MSRSSGAIGLSQAQIKMPLPGSYGIFSLIRMSQRKRQLQGLLVYHAKHILNSRVLSLAAWAWARGCEDGVCKLAANMAGTSFLSLQVVSSQGWPRGLCCLLAA